MSPSSESTNTNNSNVLLGAIDQGTSSTRFMIFDLNGKVVATYQIEFESFLPQPGWAEQCPKLILKTVCDCMQGALKELESNTPFRKENVKAIGITNQRETTVAWNKKTGEPLCNAIVWHDTRTSPSVESSIQRTPSQSKHHFSKETGLPISTYFSALKMRWMLDNIEAVQVANQEGNLLFGTIDSWLIYNLLGGATLNAIHATDVTNASRTHLLDINTLKWSPTMLEFYNIFHTTLPQIFPSSYVYGKIASGLCFEGVPISGCLGDQQAALVGQSCFQPGEAKCTLGTGGFLMVNMGTQPVYREGFLTTLGYHVPSLGGPVYALEGSIASVGTTLQFLQKNLGLVKDMTELNQLAKAASPDQDLYCVPAFSGLLSPYWQPKARALIIGFHLGVQIPDVCRCFLESIAFQTCDLVQRCSISSLKVDGGVSHSNLGMQWISDFSNVQVIRPNMQEATALGAAMAAGYALGYALVLKDESPFYFSPTCSDEYRSKRLKKWKKAVERSLDWVDE